MIQPVNNISFKAIWEKPHKYNAEQSRTITEIKARLGERIFENDYLIEPGAKDNKVLLYKFENLKYSNSGVRTSYDKKIYIGAYNEENPFLVKDLKEADKFIEQANNSNKVATIVMLALGILGVVLSVVLPKNKIKTHQANSIEQVTKPVVDSLQQAKKDTINFLK